MFKLLPRALAIALALALPAAVRAHSLEEIDQSLRNKERYFQPMDQDAPDFALQGSEGRTVRLADLRGKVLILNFIYTSCGDVCPLHTDRLAQIQTLVNQTPMKGMVEFVSITTDPTRDTSQVLLDYAKAHGVDPGNWTF